MIEVSAPGKIYLYGEHAVVYGYPAIACAIDKRTTIKAKELKNNEIILEPKDLGFRSLKIKQNQNKEIELPNKEIKKLDYIKKSIKKIFTEYNTKTGLKLEIKSDLPVGGGLGSSATVVIATLYATKEILGLNTPKEKIAKMGYEVEKEVQGEASPCDTFTTTMGGLTKVRKDKELKNKKPPQIPLVIGSTGKKSPTKKLVQEVKELKGENPGIIKNLFKTIEEITKRGEKAIDKGDLEKIAELMNINQGILDALGINNQKLSKLIYYTRKNGALGSKITGAGGGGCMVALGEKKEKIAEAIKLANGEPIKTNLTNEGVKIN